ncbi:MAG: hypothetical protein ACRCUT_13975, partial [Spirochaetota bacterium]
MQNVKYHAANIAAVTLFSFVCAITINAVVRFVLAPVQYTPSPMSSAAQQGDRKAPVNVDSIVNSGFFRKAAPESAGGDAPAASDLAELILMGTITGPDSLSCAMIKKRTETAANI